jgi:hypothetical protein
MAALSTTFRRMSGRAQFRSPGPWLKCVSLGLLVAWSAATGLVHGALLLICLVTGSHSPRVVFDGTCLGLVLMHDDSESGAVGERPSGSAVHDEPAHADHEFHARLLDQPVTPACAKDSPTANVPVVVALAQPMARVESAPRPVLASTRGPPGAVAALLDLCSVHLLL